ncbi:Tricarboxylate transport membrane protein TctA [Halomonas citrativorans]|uniref:Tricarboxylate transport membrane protein TctA n=1 Tax=Halomonas citrativorans TaxID=2742612 RepID=A0A1R4HZ32_9GAMM|nr:tripartite tricarboxylate transporter permease [Halomonas citrativorans]MBE0402574.1 tripartite tricarboxylate transporter permease [Halomonas citrativorans]SJN12820.1 Tricarboxylate transport membrane protein TctA [Halomonas citrativorans]
MEIINNLALGISVAFTLENLMYCALGVTIGMFIGVIPGVGHLAAISMLLPLTYYVPATTALVMLAGIYYGAQYGGSTAAILLNLPGTPSSSVICLDGYPMSKNGRAGVALFMTTIASFVGSFITVIVLAAFAPPLANFAVAFNSADYFAMMLLGLVAAAILVQGSPAKGLAAVVFGLMLGMVGTDVSTGIQRYTFGLTFLYDGINIVAIAMGIFGVTEVIANVGKVAQIKNDQKITFRSLLPTKRDVKDSVFPILRGTGIGTGIGILPGTGTSIGSFIAYALEKRISKDPSKFGKGAIEGITAPESANNAAAQSAFIPTLTLGIPGDAVMALMLGALLIHGITPGPNVISDNPDLFWGLVVSFLIGNLLLLILNIPMVGLWVRLLKIPYPILYPAIILFIVIGVYSINYANMDIMLVAMFGVIGCVLLILGFEPAPLLLGYILGPMMEENFRRAMLISRGDLMVFLERPVSATFFALIALFLCWSIYSAIKQRRSPVEGEL